MPYHQHLECTRGGQFEVSAGHGIVDAESESISGQVGAGLVGSFLGNSLSKTAGGRGGFGGKTALFRSLGSPGSAEELVLSNDLPVLSKSVDIATEFLSSAGKHSSVDASHKSSDLLEVFLVAVLDGNTDPILEGAESNVLVVANHNVEGVLIVADLVVVDRVVAHGRDTVLVAVAGSLDSVDGEFTPAGNLENIVTDADGSGLNETVIVPVLR